MTACLDRPITFQADDAESEAASAVAAALRGAPVDHAAIERGAASNDLLDRFYWSAAARMLALLAASAGAV